MGQEMMTVRGPIRALVSETFALVVGMFAAVALAVPALERRARFEGGKGAASSHATKIALACGALVVAGHLALFWSLDALPFQDLPNHLTRAVAELDLFARGGVRFGRLFAFDPQLSPYIGGDALLAALVAAFGPTAAGKLWVIAVAASLPLALAVYLRVTRHAWSTILMGCLLSVYLTTDWFFVMGMHHYRVAIACILLALAAWEAWLRDGSPRALLAWTLLVATGYLVHLSALLFGAVGAGVVALVALRMRHTTWRRTWIGGVPLVVLLAWQAFSARGVPGGAMAWGGTKKLLRLVMPFYRYDALTDGVLLMGFALCCTVLLLGGRRHRAERRFVTPALLAGVFLVVYVVIPYSKGTVSAADGRALPYVAVFALMAGVAAAEHGGWRKTAVTVLASALAAANLAFLAAYLPAQNAVMRQYRAVAAQVPPGSRVLPVASGAACGHTSPYQHAGAFATLEAAAYTPYLFTSEITPYFRYRTHVAPPVGESWYHEGKGLNEDQSAAVAAEFEYLLLLDPFDPAHLAVRTEPVTRSGAARLLKIVR